MAILRIPDQDLTLENDDAIARELAAVGIAFERWRPAHPVAGDAPETAILAAYHDEIEKLKKRGGYVTADVIDIVSDTPGLDEMLAKFNREHWHDEDEVRFVIEGHGLFHIRPEEGSIMAIEVEAGDLLCLPRGTWHWFDLCADRRIRAIRLFQDPDGWTPHYTDSGAEKGYLPICMGRPAHLN